MYYEFILAVQTKLAFMLIYLYYNNELFFLSGTVLLQKLPSFRKTKNKKIKLKTWAKLKKVSYLVS